MAAVPELGRATQVTPRVAPAAVETQRLYERYAGQILGFCLHQLGNREEAEDATQTTFLNAFRGLKRGVAPEAEQAWLYKIAQNVCRTRRRSSYRRGRVERPSDIEALQDFVAAPQRMGTDELMQLHEALAGMPATQRRAILLREWRGLSYREIADDLGLTQSAVETLIFRARRSLAQGLERPPHEARRIWRRLRHGFDVGSLLAVAKGLFAGGAAVKAVAAATAVGTVSVVAALPSDERGRPAPGAEPVAAAPAASAPEPVPAPSVAPVRRPASPAPADVRVRRRPASPAPTPRPAAAMPAPSPVPAVSSVPAASAARAPAPAPAAEPARPKRPVPARAAEPAPGRAAGRAASAPAETPGGGGKALGRPDEVPLAAAASSPTPRAAPAGESRRAQPAVPEQAAPPAAGGRPEQPGGGRPADPGEGRPDESPAGGEGS